VSCGSYRVEVLDGNPPFKCSQKRTLCAAHFEYQETQTSLLEDSNEDLKIDRVIKLLQK